MAIKDQVGTLETNANKIKDPIMKIASATASTSIMKLTKDQVFQFPIIMEADIDDDEKFPIIKSIEKNYAAIVMTAISNSGEIDRNKYPDINTYLRKFHNNSDIPFSVNESYSVESAIVTEGYLPEKDLRELWDCVEEQLDSENLNDMYLPFARTASKLSRAIEAANGSNYPKVPGDNDTKFFRRIAYKKDKNGDIIKDNNGNPIPLTDNVGNILYDYIQADPTSSKYSAYKKGYGDPLTASQWNDTNLDKKIADAAKSKEAEMELKKQDADLKKQQFEYQKSQALANALSKKPKAEMVKDEKFNTMTPTILKIGITNTKKDVGAWSQELVIGVKAMPRFIPQSVMISNMIEMCKNRLVFKFIKWTRGEIGWADILFGIGRAREDASMKAERKWMKILRNRAKKAKLYRVGGMSLNPNCTIIITDADAHLVQDKCGVNLHDITNVHKLMDKYFLLGFGIYDAEAKMFNIIYDGESSFTTISLRNMIAESKKDMNLLAMNKY